MKLISAARAPPWAAAGGQHGGGDTAVRVSPTRLTLSLSVPAPGLADPVPQGLAKGWSRVHPSQNNLAVTRPVASRRRALAAALRAAVQPPLPTRLVPATPGCSRESPGCAALPGWKLILLGRVTGTGDAETLLGCQVPWLPWGWCTWRHPPCHLRLPCHHLPAFSAGWELRDGEMVGGEVLGGERWPRAPPQGEVGTAVVPAGWWHLVAGDSDDTPHLNLRQEADPPPVRAGQGLNCPPTLPPKLSPNWEDACQGCGKPPSARSPASPALRGGPAPEPAAPSPAPQRCSRRRLRRDLPVSEGRRSQQQAEAGPRVRFNRSFLSCALLSTLQAGAAQLPGEPGGSHPLVPALRLRIRRRRLRPVQPSPRGWV